MGTASVRKRHSRICKTGCIPVLWISSKTNISTECASLRFLPSQPFKIARKLSTLSRPVLTDWKRTRATCLKPAKVIPSSSSLRPYHVMCFSCQLFHGPRHSLLIIYERLISHFSGVQSIISRRLANLRKEKLWEWYRIEGMMDKGKEYRKRVRKHWRESKLTNSSLRSNLKLIFRHDLPLFKNQNNRKTKFVVFLIIPDYFAFCNTTTVLILVKQIAMNFLTSPSHTQPGVTTWCTTCIMTNNNNNSLACTFAHSHSMPYDNFQ